MTRSIFRPIQLGSCLYPRYGIVDNRKPYKKLRYWTGKKRHPWTNNIAKAARWTEYAAVLETMETIGREEFNHFPERKFTVSLDISLIGSKDITREDVIEFIERTLILQMDYNSQGQGPVNPETEALRGLIYVALDRNKIQEVSNDLEVNLLKNGADS